MLRNAKLDALPPEIVSIIHGFLDPPSTLHLALVSRQTASLSVDALKLGRDRAELYRTVCFRDLRMVDAVLQDSAVAWHVRCLELWDGGDMVHEDEDQGGGPRNAATGAMSELSLFDSDELHTMNWPFTGLGRPAGSQRRCQAFRRITDTPSPVLPASADAERLPPSPLWSRRGPSCQLPKRHRSGLVVCSSSPNESTSQSAYDILDSYTNSILCHIITAIHKLPQPIWPESLNSLRQLAVGLPSQEAGGRAVLPCTRVLPLFLLPNLETVYMRGPAVTAREFEAHAQPDFQILPPASSSVRHLCFEACIGDRSTDAICDAIAACRNLSTLVLSSCEIPSGFQMLTDTLSLNQESDLKTWLPCGDLSRMDQEYPGNMYLEVFSHFQLNILPVELDWILSGMEVLEAPDCAVREACQIMFKKLSDDIGDPETVILHGNADINREQRTAAHYMSVVDEGIAGLCAPIDGKPRRLKGMYLDQAVDSLMYHAMIEERTLRFPNTRQAAERYGIGVHFEHGAMDAFGDEMCRNIFGVGLTLDQLK